MAKRHSRLVGMTMDRKATRRRNAEMLAEPKCGKCNKSGHVPRECKATWRKAWPGQYVTSLGIRWPDGSSQNVSDVIADKLLTIEQP